MLSFLHCWDAYWKCEVDTDVKIENYYYHDGEQLGFHKKTIYYNAEKDVLRILPETKNFNLFDKNWTQENVKCHIQREKNSRRWIVTEQVNYR